MVYRAKVDGWLAALIGILALLEVGAAAVVVAVGHATGEPAPAAALGIGSAFAGVGLVMGLVLWGCYKTQYEITASELVVRFGPYRTSLPLDAMVEVLPTRNPLSALAPSPGQAPHQLPDKTRLDVVCARIAEGQGGLSGTSRAPRRSSEALGKRLFDSRRSGWLNSLRRAAAPGNRCWQGGGLR